MRRRNSDFTTLCLFAFYGDNAIEAALSSDPTEHSLQHGFPTVSSLVRSNSVLVGMILLVPMGIGIGVVGGSILETVFPLKQRLRPTSGAMAGGLLGAGIWLCTVVAVPIWVRFVLSAPVAVPFVHWGSLIGLVTYGIVFGSVFALIRESASNPIQLAH